MRIAVVQVVPQDASEATTRGEAVQDFATSPQARYGVAASSAWQRPTHLFTCASLLYHKRNLVVLRCPSGIKGIQDFGSRSDKGSLGPDCLHTKGSLRIWPMEELSEHPRHARLRSCLQHRVHLHLAAWSCCMSSCVFLDLTQPRGM